MPTQPSYWKVLTRRKILKNDASEETKLNRVLGVFDLTALGVGSTLGAGVYVLAGQIAKDQAGPSVMISFAIAALASALAGVCYAEFGARVPKAGSAYVYSYVCIGEFVAFIIGWNLILEYVIGTAGVCRSISLYLDTLLNDTLKTSFTAIAPIQWDFLGGYFDFLAFALAVIFGVTTAFGVETSTILNNVCTLLNISVLLFVIIAGSIKAQISNWQVDPLTNFTESDYNIGKGGYFPFGFEGTLKGAATCFFGFVGFDCIATTGEEVRNPQQNIPRSILYSLLIIFLCYFGVSTVLTLMVPYYMQDPNAPLPYAFKQVGWNFAMWVVTIGGLIGLLASLFGALFPIPRIMYSMAEDGLLFRFLGKISSRFKTPVTGSIIAAFLTGIMAGTFSLAQLVNLLSIGTLLAYTVVAISVTILRFMNSDSEANSYRAEGHTTENSMLTSNGTRWTFKMVFSQVFNFQRLSTPNSFSTKIVGSLIILFCIISLSCGLLIMNASEAIMNHEAWAIGLLSIFVSLMVTLLTAIWMQPKESYTPIFRVPLVPLVPALSIFINIYLMLQLDITTWIRFGLWMIIGLPIFLICYCTTDKSNRQIKNRKQEFMESLQTFNIICNNQLKVFENGVCNSSVKIVRSQLSKEQNPQGRDEEKYNNSQLDEITSISLLVESEKGYAVGNSDSLPETQLNDFEAEQLEEDPCTIATMEDENSVIAMLDDVLQMEDDDTTSPDYHQQTSIDSEITPYCVKTTTAAEIHNNCEPNLNELHKTNQTNLLYTNDVLYMEIWQLALNLVDDILQSDKLVFSVEANKKCNDNIEESIQYSMGDLKRSPHSSESSDLTQYSLDENPLHSDNFKNKLSLLMAQPPLVNRPKKSETQPSLISELKPPTSEANVDEMKEIPPTTANTINLGKQSQDIPKPPRFDPVLYRTIGKISQTSNRTRPGIEKLTVDRPNETLMVEPQEELPFKAKLEAILKRGPSHRMQKRSDFITPKNTLPVDKSSSSENQVQTKLKPYVLKKSSPLRTTTRRKSSSSNVDIINDIRKKLRHVNVDTQK